MIDRHPLNPQTRRDIKYGLLYGVQWVERTNFTPRSGKAVQFTCPAVMLIASLVASGISSVGFSRSDICGFERYLKYWTVWKVCMLDAFAHACFKLINKVRNKYFHKLVLLKENWGMFHFAFSAIWTSFHLHRFPFYSSNVFPFPLVLGNSIMEQCCWKPFLYVFM